MEDLEEQTERRTLTYSRWENQVKGKGREGWHPVTYTFQDATVQAIRDIQVCIFPLHRSCILAAVLNLHFKQKQFQDRFLIHHFLVLCCRLYAASGMRRRIERSGARLQATPCPASCLPESLLELLDFVSWTKLRAMRMDSLYHRPEHSGGRQTPPDSTP